MDKPYDVVLKTLVEVGPAGWPKAVHLPTAPVDVVDADIATLSGAVDKVLRVRTDPPYLLHLDFYAGHDTARAPRHSTAPSTWTSAGRAPVPAAPGRW